MSSININERLTEVHDYFSPKIVEEVNDAYIKVAKIMGDKIPWHVHENEDELFYVLKGSMLLETENNVRITMNPGDLFVVRKGINHRVSSETECHIMLIENKTTEHTGKVESEITKSIDEQRDL